MAKPWPEGEPISCSPPEIVFRVSKQGRTPFSPPPWTRAIPDGTFGGRFDDPSSASPEAERFRIVYVASSRETALDESIAQFRPSLRTFAELGPIDPTVMPRLAVGIVSSDWRSTRQMGEAELDGTLRFVDIAAHRTLTYLRAALASVASALGIDDIDLSAVTGPQRRFTQACALHLYALRASDGEPLYAGIRYPSRLAASWECWAIYADRLRGVQTLPRPILSDDLDLIAAAAHLGLTVEDAGHP